MLKLAIEAGIPVIAVRTTDLVNIAEVMQSIAPGSKKFATGVHYEDGVVAYALEGACPPVDESFYKLLAEAGSVLVLVNPENVTELMFDAGEVPVPKELVEKYLKMVVGHKMPFFMRCASGLTIKQMTEVIKLAQVTEGPPLTPRAMMRVRSMLIGNQPGLQPVDKNMPCYMPVEELDSWIKVNKPYFLEGPDHRLVPRGLLFDGEPGVGKTAGSKYLAEQLGVELYRLDLPGALSKWHGQSESNLRRILGMLDQEEPCVVLIDEIEKVFGGKDDDGVAQRLLTQLLWWLQEHRSRVLTVMTTNNLHSLPVELYRPGRIDEVIRINKLESVTATVLSLLTLKSFLPDHTTSQQTAVKDAIDKRMYVDKALSHAEVVKTVEDLLKQKQWV